MKCTVSEKFEMCGGGRIILPATLVSSSEVLIAVSLRHMETVLSGMKRK